MSETQSPSHGWAFAAVGFISGFILGCIVAGMIGLLVGERGQQRARYEEERYILGPELAKDLAFSAISVNEYSGGGIWLGGHVHTTADKERLRQLVIRAIGERRAALALAGVDVDVHSRH